jgi:hypothetical protein
VVIEANVTGLLVSVLKPPERILQIDGKVYTWGKTV